MFSSRALPVVVVSVCVFAALCAAEEVSGAEAVYDFSSGDLSEWAIVGGGGWTVEGGQMVQTLPPFHEAMAFAPVEFTEGTVRFEGSIATSDPSSTIYISVGLARYVDDSNFWHIRCGDYGGMALKGPVGVVVGRVARRLA